MTKVKICGLRETRHALLAAEHGADFLGFVFTPGVRRRLDVDEARRVIAAYREGRCAGGALSQTKGGPKLVGIFTDQPLEEVNNVIRACGLDMAQLCGNEPLEYCAQVVCPVIKVVHVRGDTPPQQEVERVREILEAFQEAGCLVTLDRRAASQAGGLGEAFNWTIARKLASTYDFILAGGLTPEKVAGAVQRVRPWGVDVSSGVETGGVKDDGKIASFLAAVRRAEAGLPALSGRKPTAS